MKYTDEFTRVAAGYGFELDPFIRKQGVFFFRRHDWYYRGILIDTVGGVRETPLAYYADYAITCLKLGYLMKGSCELSVFLPEGYVEGEGAARELDTPLEAERWATQVVLGFEEGIAKLENQYLHEFTATNRPYLTLALRYIESDVASPPLEYAAEVARKVARDYRFLAAYEEAVNILASRAPAVEPDLQIDLCPDGKIRAELQTRLHFIAEQIVRNRTP